MPSTATPDQPLGRVFLPNEPGTGVGEFQFVAEADVIELIEVGSMVAAETVEGTFVGAIVDMRTVGTNSSPHRTNFEGFEAVIGEKEAKDELARVATVSVFHSPARRPITEGLVRAATAQEVELATGKQGMKWPIPAGVKHLVGGGMVAACVDGEFVLGKEGGHVLALGTSGLAAKTSQTSVLVKSAITHGGPKLGRPGVAALMFSPKSDLLYLDSPPGAEDQLQPSDFALYEAMGVDPSPFEHVDVYAPGMPGGHDVNSVRADAMPVRLGLRDAISSESLRFWFPWVMEDEKLMSFFSAFEDRKLNSPRAGDKITSFYGFDQWCQAQLDDARANESQLCDFANTHVMTLHRIRRMVMGLVPRAKGLLTADRPDADNDIHVDNFTHGMVKVVDIAALPQDARAYLIARTLSRLLKQAEEGRLEGMRIVCYVDELNEMFDANAPRPLRQLIHRIVSQGRYAGISLIGAAQRTQGTKLPELMVNMATTMVGRTSDNEVTSGNLGRIKPGLAETIVTLPKGQTTLFHYSYRSPMVINFPRPAWRTGPPSHENGGRVRPTLAQHTAAQTGMSEKGLERLKEGLDEEVVERVIAGADDPARAVAELAKHREPDMSRTELVADVDEDLRDDPFQID